MKKILIGAVVIIVVVGAIIVATGKKKANKYSGGDVVVESGVKGNSTFKDFMSGAMGANMTCDFTHGIAKDNEINVKTYISGKKVRVDYTMKNPVPGPDGSTQKDMHIISDGEYSHIWGDSFLGNMMGGMKMKIDDMENSDSGSNGVYQTAMLEEDMPMTNCKSWTPDNSLFEIPSDIEFVDPDNMMGSMLGGMDIPGYGGGDCSICANLPADQIEGCRDSLGCE